MFSADARVAEIRICPCLGPQSVSDLAPLKNRDHFKRSCAAALAEWLGLLAALSLSGAVETETVRICLTAPFWRHLS
jgi:hypothetical protein